MQTRLAGLALLILGTISPALAGPRPAADAEAMVRRVLAHAIIIDTHADTPQRIADEGYDLADPLNGGNWNLESAHKGNLGAEFFSIWVDPEPNKDISRIAPSC